MLLSVSFVWLVLTGPYGMWSLVTPNPKTQEERDRKTLLKIIFFLLMYINHAINFYLYCLTGRKFRRELIALVSVLRHQAKLFRRRSSRTITSYLGRKSLNAENGRRSLRTSAGNKHNVHQGMQLRPVIKLSDRTYAKELYG